MVAEWGMNDRVGFVFYGDDDSKPNALGGFGGGREHSDDTAKAIDEEVRGVIDAAYARARKTLTDHLDEVHALARALLEFETLSGEEIRMILRGEPIQRDFGYDEPPTTGAKGKEPTRRSSVPTTAAKTGFGPGAEPQPGA